MQKRVNAEMLKMESIFDIHHQLHKHHLLSKHGISYGCSVSILNPLNPFSLLIRKVRAMC